MSIIAFIGLGIMGRPMAKNLLKAGHQLIVHDVVRGSVDEVVANGAARGESSSDVASKSEIVITMLPDGPDVEAAVFGPAGVLEGARKGCILVDMSSISPMVSQKIGAACAAKGVEFLDAPVSGGPQYAAAGTIAIMAGCTAQQYTRIEPTLKSISPNVFHCGDVGTGHVAKVCNNLMAASQRLLTFEVVALAVKNGLAPEQAVEVMLKSSGRNYTLDVTMRRHILPGELFQGFTLGLMHKDVGLAMQLAASSGVPLFFGGLVRQFYQSIINERGADADVNYAVKVFERLADVQITPADKKA